MKRSRFFALAVLTIASQVAAVSAHALGNGTGERVPPLAVPWAPEPPDGAPYSQRMDLAEIDARYPIPPDVLRRMTMAHLASYSQSQLDQIYARLVPGPIPHGSFDGRILIRDEGILRSIESLALSKGWQRRMFNGTFATLAENFLWWGKRFDTETRILMNRIPAASTLAQIYSGLNGDFSRETLRRNLSIWGRGELFPARLYCGQSLLDSRRESVIIDYADAASLPGYAAEIDDLAGREFFSIRDEIRMVRPGLYLGRAYMKNVFVLNFALYNAAAAASGRVAGEPCWDGRSPR